MKKSIIIIASIILTIAIIASIACVTSVNKFTAAHTRTAEAEVIEINDNVVAVETADGNIWEFYGEGYEVGQQVKVLFSNNGSPNCYKDDTIQKVF